MLCKVEKCYPKVRGYYLYDDRDLVWVAPLWRVGSKQSSSAPGKDRTRGRGHKVTAVELEGMSFGKPGWLTSGITDYRKSTPGLKTLRHFHLKKKKNQVILINIKSSKKGLPKYGIIYMFNPSSTSVMDLGVLCLLQLHRQLPSPQRHSEISFFSQFQRVGFFLTTRQVSNTSWVFYNSTQI